MAERLVGYGPNGEDIVLWRALKERTPGFYVDVGAFHPLDDSVTKLFSLRGWSGINIEPQPHYARLLQQDRPRDVTLGVGVGAQPGHLELFFVPEDAQRSTFYEPLAASYRAEGYRVDARTVPVLTLDQILEDHPLPRIDFLKIDAEGFEDEVLGGIDLSRHRPTVIVAEDPGVFASSVTQRLEGAGYRQRLFDGLNRYFVTLEEDDRLGPALVHPATTLDEWVPAAVARVEAERDRARDEAGAALGEVARLRGELASLRASRAWRVSRVLAAVVKPLARGVSRSSRLGRASGLGWGRTATDR